MAIIASVACANEPAAVSQSKSSASQEEVAKVRYEGIDVSHFQGDVDWKAVKTAGIHFAFAKATQGESEVDPHFAQNWAGMKEAGIVRGAYHFFDPNTDAAAQAKHFIATVQLEPGDLPPVIDIETSEGETRAEIDDGVQTWLEAVAKAFGITPIIYSDDSFIKRELGGRFSSYPLWYAEYTEASEPELPQGDWQKWTFWQYSESGRVAGVEGAVDRDVFRGSKAEWDELVFSP